MYSTHDNLAADGRSFSNDLIAPIKHARFPPSREDFDFFEALCDEAFYLASLTFLAQQMTLAIPIHIPVH
jgi:hypothetical protein